MILARDRFGVKPLFYAQDEDKLIFGSEPKTLFAAGFEKKINDKALNELFYYRYTNLFTAQKA